MTPERQQRLTTVLSRRQGNLTVLLENVFDPHNVSAVMRTCDAIGIQEVYVLNNRIRPHKKWGHRSSSTASRWLTIHQFTDVATCFEAIRKKYERIYAGYLGERSTDLYEMDFTGSMALVFGNESFGVHEAVRKLADGDFVVPQMGIIRSLNISVACAVTLYEAFRQKRIAGHYERSSLSPGEAARIAAEWGLPEDW